MHLLKTTAATTKSWMMLVWLVLLQQYCRSFCELLNNLIAICVYKSLFHIWNFIDSFSYSGLSVCTDIYRMFACVCLCIHASSLHHFVVRMFCFEFCHLQQPQQKHRKSWLARPFTYFTRNAAPEKREEIYIYRKAKLHNSNFMKCVVKLILRGIFHSIHQLQSRLGC